MFYLFFSNIKSNLHFRILGNLEFRSLHELSLHKSSYSATYQCKHLDERDGFVFYNWLLVAMCKDTCAIKTLKKQLGDLTSVFNCTIHH